MSEIVLEETQIDTAKVEVFGRNIEIILPTTEFTDGFDNLFTYRVKFPLSPSPYETTRSREFNNMLYKGNDGKYCNLQENGFRHISMAELVQILSKRSSMDNKTYNRVMQALVVLNGYSVKEEEGHWGIYIDDGIRVEGEEAIVFKGLSGKLKFYKGGEYPLEMWGASYHIDKGCSILSERFSIKRLFREKLQDEIKDRPLKVKDLYDANPDLVEYLFEQEFSDLPEDIQQMAVRFPLGSDKERENDEERGLFVMPMAVLYRTEMVLGDLEGTQNLSTELCQGIRGFRIRPYMLSMPANYCNSVSPVKVIHWGVRGER